MMTVILNIDFSDSPSFHHHGNPRFNH